MLRKEAVFLKLKELTETLSSEELCTKSTGFNANQLSEILGSDRSNVSRDLNALVVEGRALKVNGRPVYFLEKNAVEKANGRSVAKKDSATTVLNHEFTFHNLIGANGSLKMAVQQAKASILYPGNSLNILLTGATGAGKTTFAELIYNYAKEQECIDKTGKLVVFNCSEYADNPQLLLDQLFGHVKGAYTGADTEKAGLIEKAEGGVLLLDEIHRLGPEGQEMLFLFIDKGCYRKLGESEHMRTGNVMLVAATTENPESYLLKTFVRRFPMIIKIPSLDDRPWQERYEFIKTFFSLEAKAINLPIEVEYEAMNMLLLYPCPANIGQLRADIQLICARGFLECMTENGREIYIEGSMLPEHVLNGFRQIQTSDIPQEVFELKDRKNSFFFREINDVADAPVEPDYKDRYHRIFSRYRRLVGKGEITKQEKNEIYRKINRYIDEVFNENIQDIQNSEKERIQKESIYKNIKPEIYDATIEALTNVLGADGWSVELAIALAMHIEAMEYRIAGKISQRTGSRDLSRVSSRIIHNLEERLDIFMDEDEEDFISMILEGNSLEESEKLQKIGVVLVSLEENLAGSLTDGAKKFAQNSDIETLVYGGSSSNEFFTSELLKKVKAANNGKGVLVFSDMELSFLDVNQLESSAACSIRIISPYSIPMFFEACRKVLRRNQNILALSEELIDTQIKRYLEKMDAKKNLLRLDKPEKKFILTTCITGEGTAVKLAERIQATIPNLIESGVEIIPLDVEQSHVDSVLQKYEKQTIAIVGAVAMNMDDVPFISLEEWVLQDGIDRLKKLVEEQGTFSPYMCERDKIIKAIRESTVFIDAEKVYSEALISFHNLHVDCETQRIKSLEIRFLIHVACMIERIIQKLPVEYPNIEDLEIKLQAEFINTKDAISNIESAFGIEIPDNEIGFLIDLIYTK